MLCKDAHDIASYKTIYICILRTTTTIVVVVIIIILCWT